MIEFELTDKQRQLKEMIETLGRSIVRPQSLAWDREHELSHDFLRQFVMMTRTFSTKDRRSGFLGSDESAKEKPRSDKPSLATARRRLASEALAWCGRVAVARGAGPGARWPPVRSSGTPGRSSASSGFQGLTVRNGGLRADGAGGGSDVAPSARAAEGRRGLDPERAAVLHHDGWGAELDGDLRTVDPSLGRAGHRAFGGEGERPVSGRQDRGKMGLRAARRRSSAGDGACRATTCSGGAAYCEQGGLMTAMKTFDTTRPLVAAMACRHRARGVRRSRGISSRSATC